MSWKNLLRKNKPEYFDVKAILHWYSIENQLGSLCAPGFFLFVIGLLALLFYLTGQDLGQVTLNDIVFTIHFGLAWFILNFVLVFIEYVTGLNDLIQRHVFKSAYKKHYGKLPTL